MKMALKELKKDFKDCLSDIDFKEYDPWSKKFMKASFIGQMWFLMKALHDDDDVEDELRHAGILIKKHYEWADDDKKTILEEHENKRQELMKRLESDKE